jgi:hypothetical protein
LRSDLAPDKARGQNATPVFSQRYRSHRDKTSVLNARIAREKCNDETLARTNAVWASRRLRRR